MKTKTNGETLQRKGQLATLWRRLCQSPSAMIGMVVFGALVILAVGAPWIAPYDYAKLDVLRANQGPSWQHLCGTDQVGRDIFSRLLYGARYSLTLGICATLLGTVAGMFFGALAGYFGGVVDEVLMRINDALTAFPNILLALVFIAMLGFGKYNVILALGVAFIPSFARVVRAEFARHRAMNYVKSARLMGASHLRIIFRHILPNTWGVLLPALIIGFNNAVLAEASMSYLGIGVAPPDISLGYMLSESQSYMIKAPWYVLCTGLVIVLLILGVSMMGEGLRKEDV